MLSSEQYMCSGLTLLSGWDEAFLVSTFETEMPKAVALPSPTLKASSRLGKLIFCVEHKLTDAVPCGLLVCVKLC